MIPLPRDPESLPPEERHELLTAYLDGELSADAARDVTAWLERHPEALREVEHQRRLWDLLGRYGAEPVPAGFAERALKSAGIADAARSGRQRLAPVPLALLGARSRWAYGAAAAVLLAIGAFALGRRGSEVPPVPTEVATLESIDLDFVQNANLDELLALSDEQFAVLLAGHPDALADASLGDAGEPSDGARGG